MTGAEFNEFCKVLAQEDAGEASAEQSRLPISGEKWREGAQPVLAAFGFPDVLKGGGR